MNTEIMIKREVAVKTLLVRVRQKSYYNKKMVKVREVQNKFIRENDNFISRTIVCKHIVCGSRRLHIRKHKKGCDFYVRRGSEVRA